MDGIAELNPFRYRGYYFDVQTGLYYLKTRYYDPETGRFINADGISVLNESAAMINGLNLYAYCGNNPVNYIDPSGKFFWWIFAAVVAAVVVLVSELVVRPWHYARLQEQAQLNAISEITLVEQNKRIEFLETTENGWKEEKRTTYHEFGLANQGIKKFLKPTLGTNASAEIIIDKDGNLILTPANIGTYNYFHPGTFWGDIGHFFADVLPYYLYRNSADDPIILPFRLFGSGLYNWFYGIS